MSAVEDRTPEDDGRPRLRVLILTRSYPTAVLPTLGLWIERPTRFLAQDVDISVISPVPYCPALPNVGPLRQFVRFRRVPRATTRDDISIFHPRFLSGPGGSLYRVEAWALAAAAAPVAEQLHTQRPFDLIHAHFIYPEGAAAHRLSRRLGVPFLVTEHAPWTPTWFASSRVRREALAAARAARAILPVSRSVRRTILERGLPPDDVRVVPVGVDPDRFVLGAPDARRSDQVLYVGFINFNKGVDVLLNAVSVLRERSSHVRLVVVGDAHYRKTRLQQDELRALCSSLGVDDVVEWVGRQPEEEVARLMAESAVLVLPSRAESFGAVLVEALACGTPVIATRCGGPEDIVTDDVGLLVQPDDPEALADAVDAILAARDRFRPAELRDYAVSRFSWREIADSILDEYRAVVVPPPANRDAPVARAFPREIRL